MINLALFSCTLPHKSLFLISWAVSKLYDSSATQCIRNSLQGHSSSWTIKLARKGFVCCNS